MQRSPDKAGGSHVFSTHPRRAAELERLRRQALAAWPEERQWLQRFGLGGGMRVLDAGCGPGFVTCRLAQELNSGGETMGLEPDPVLAGLAAEAFAGQSGLSLHQGSLSRNALEEGSFDFAYARFVLQHLREPVAELRGLARLLRPGGKAVLVDADDGLMAFHPQPPELDELMRLLAERQARAGGDRRVGRKLPHLLAEAGFTGIGFHVLPFTSHALGREALLDLAVSSRLLRLAPGEAPKIEALAERVQAFFRGADWHGVACVVAAVGLRPGDG